MVVVEHDGTKPVIMVRTDIPDASTPLARRIIYRANRIAELDLSWDGQQIAADLEAGMDLDDMFSGEEMAAILEKAADEMMGDKGAQYPEADSNELFLERREVPDAIWPTDNKWGVPLLDVKMQARALSAPVAKWGVQSRRSLMPGTYHFYVEDYKFNALWTDPSVIINSQCTSVIEPNFTTGKDMPNAVALWGIYRKRWLARYWQSYGVSVFVDLNVEPCFAELNMLGVPKGWAAYATRWRAQDCDDIPTQFALAQELAGDVAVLFVVVGGRDRAEAMCQEHGWLWVKEHAGEVNDG